VLFANVVGMNMTVTTRGHSRLPTILGIVRAFAEGSLLVFGLGGAILVIGMPFALAIGGLHEGLSHLAQLVGLEWSSLVQAAVYVTSVVGGIAVGTVFARWGVRGVRSWPGFRTRLSGRVVQDTQAPLQSGQPVAQAAWLKFRTNPDVL
jgi:hypothetical protein